MNRFLSILLAVTAIAVSGLFFTSCEDDSGTKPSTSKEMKIAVFTDPHYFSPSLGTSGAAFEQYLAMDRKLIAESQAILEATVAAIIADKPDVVIVPGDLTKDGEKVTHEEFAAYMRQIEDAGAKVYVIPGNHDVDNPASYSYSGNNRTLVPTVSAQEFAQIYADFGYDEAKYKDPNSLSYVAEPVKGIWLLGMDACRYKENPGKTHPVTGGRFSQETFTWIKNKLQEAKDSKIRVFGFLHHGILEHFAGQKSNPVSSEYVIDDCDNAASEFASLGLEIVFTGHFHSNDIVMKDYGGNVLYDIETGSTITFPCPYRVIDYDGETKFDISTKYIESINYDTQGMSFPDYAKNYLQSGMLGLIEYTLMNQFGVSEEEAEQLAPLMLAAFMAHYQGDERYPDQQTQAMVEQMMQSTDPTTQLFGSSLAAMFNDPMPPDNDYVITLKAIK
ncbi:MAG: metallophosphoesterase family protein [Bacteroidota bacterium]